MLVHDRSPRHADRYRAEPDERPEDGVEAHGRQDHDRPKSKLGKRLGRLTGEEILRLNRAIVVFFGLSS